MIKIILKALILKNFMKNKIQMTLISNQNPPEKIINRKRFFKIIILQNQCNNKNHNKRIKKKNKHNNKIQKCQYQKNKMNCKSQNL